MADAKPAAGGGGSNAFPFIIFLLIVVSLFNSGGDSGAGLGASGSQNSQNSGSISRAGGKYGGTGTGSSGTAASFSSFVLEVATKDSESGVGNTPEFSVRYRNASGRTLHNAVLEVSVPNGAEFDFHSGTRGWYRPEPPASGTFSKKGNDAAYDLGEIAPGESGTVRFAEKIIKGRDGAVQETAVAAEWETGGEGFRKKEPIVLGRAMVKTQITVRKSLAKAVPTKPENKTETETAVKNSAAVSTSSPKKSGVENTLAALSGAAGKSPMSPALGWALFALLFFAAAYAVANMSMAGASAPAASSVSSLSPPSSRRPLSEQIPLQETGALRRAAEREAGKGEPPENLPI